MSVRLFVTTGSRSTWHFMKFRSEWEVFIYFSDEEDPNYIEMVRNQISRAVGTNVKFNITRILNTESKKDSDEEKPLVDLVELANTIIGHCQKHGSHPDFSSHHNEKGRTAIRNYIQNTFRENIGGADLRKICDYIVGELKK